MSPLRTPTGANVDTPAGGQADPGTYTAFDGTRRIGTGALADIALAVRRALDADASGPVLIFDDTTGRSIDIDTRGTDAQIVGRFGGTSTGHAAALPEQALPTEPRGRGRPKLGVVAREVTLLPRHWDWLAAQPGGASVAMRKLVDEARRANVDRDRARRLQESAYHFMSAMAGDYAGFEEASRALFAGDAARMRAIIHAWPPDIRDHLLRLAFDA